MVVYLRVCSYRNSGENIFEIVNNMAAVIKTTTNKTIFTLHFKLFVVLFTKVISKIPLNISKPIFADIFLFTVAYPGLDL